MESRRVALIGGEGLRLDLNETGVEMAENEDDDNDNGLVVMIPMERGDALRVADLLAGYGDEEDGNIAENIRYLVKQAEG